jgi:hypothetical protein
MKSLQFILAALVATVITAQADSPNWPRTPWQPIKTQKQAEDCCAGGGKVALACPDCKTLDEKTEKKGILGWFKADSNHDCAGCKGKITVKQIGAGKVQTAEFKHECSKCKTGAFTCATHTKGAK